jgi:hypothetical protein
LDGIVEAREVGYRMKDGRSRRLSSEWEEGGDEEEKRSVHEIRNTHKMEFTE